MAFSVGTVNSLAPSKSLFETTDSSSGNASVPFAEYLKSALQSTNDLIVDSDNMASAFASGKTDNIAAVQIAAQKADLALQFTMQIRTKILDAYSEIIKMQI
ncbi:MAG: flagellar hook-basal body complex protein FliE [Clostridiales bacterium]|nr:flagellar hook-basal body complex protein FliE [Clostridiales bacterium]